MNSFKFAIRQFLKQPGFTAVAVLTLALGIGANTAMFSFVNAILLRPLPYPEPERLVMVFENHVTNGWFQQQIGAPVLAEWRRQATVFEQIGAARSYGNFALTGQGPPETLRGSAYSANIFPLLGVQPLMGRSFLPEEEVFGNHRVAVLSYGLWQRRFGGDAGILGRSITLGQEPHTVVGVMPPGTMGPDGEREVWVPLAFKSYEIEQRHSHNFTVYARLKPGIPLAQARDEMNQIAYRMAEADPQNIGWGAEVHPLHEIMVGDSRRLLLVLLGSVGFVLLIVCANIANLLLVRAAARSREFAIRTALGASPGRVVRQLLTESLILAVAGGTLGLLLSSAGLELLLQLSPPDLPRLREGVSLDGPTLAFALLITLAAGIAFGLVPAHQTRNRSLARELTESARGATAGIRSQQARSALVVAEVALSLVLLVGAGLMIRSFDRLVGQDLGYVPEHLVTMGINLPEQKYPGQDERRRLYDPLLAAVRQIPGVESAGYAYGVPLTGVDSGMAVNIEGAPAPAPGESVAAGYAQISPGYFAAMKIPLLQGRDFTDRDDTNSPSVLIVDEAFVKNFKLGADPLGKRVNVGDGTQNAEIVGVIRTVKRTGVAERPAGEMYLPYRQRCWGFLTVVVRTQREPNDISRAVRAELDRLDSDLPLENLRTMSQLVSANVAQRRLTTQLLGGFATVALLLAGLGLYGVLACAVAQRTREIGIRVALGARRWDVLNLVVNQGMRLVLIGLAVGLLGAIALTRVLDRLLFETNPTDPLTFLAVSSTLVAVAFVACWLPARRAARVDPMVALRTE